MSFKISPADDNDVREIVRIMFKSYGGNNEYINAVFPRGLTEEGCEMSIQRLLFIKNNVDGVIWEKAVDTATAKIVGGTMWLMYKEARPQKFAIDGPPGTWLTDEEKQYAQELASTLPDDEYAYLAEQDFPLMRLTIMTVDPDFQRRGAGAALLKSGLDLADNEKAPATLVATPAGKALYDKFGFYTLAERDLPVSEKFTDRPKYHIWSMARDRKVEEQA